jgi:glycosyltransferase involved in cell wall biosynthesis
MIYDKDDNRSHPLAIEKFKKANIELIGLDGSENMGALQKVLDDRKATNLYIQKTGRRNDGRYVENVPMLIHVVGMNNDPHGLVYAYVSEWSSLHCSNGQHPFVPYMAHLPDTQDNFRKKLGIPEDAIVFGRTGGYYSWNIGWVNGVVQEALNRRKDIYFLFVQTPEFTRHERVIYTEPFADLVVKRKFINTCDAFLHARNEGESFGMAVAEFSICNKPVITYKNSPERNHIFVLGDKGIYYENPQQLLDILVNFKRDESKDWNAYGDFAPEKVIQKFKTVFLDKLS